LNKYYERFAEDPEKYKDQFWVAVLAHLQRATNDEDIAGDAILKVVAGLKNYKHDGRFSAWLNTISRTCLWMPRRNQRKIAWTRTSWNVLSPIFPLQFTSGST
jgi:DNA-directed RNA polymerase specialized sigma24 family protein